MMINKRLLIKNLLAHNDENSFYDKKQQIDFSSREGKAKFLKHISALSNSNPMNNSYLVIGVKDENNDIIGVDFFDDSKIQNLVNAYLDNPPFVTYENISFPHLPTHKFVGLVIIRAKKNNLKCSLLKNIWKYKNGTIFYREGSNSMPNLNNYIINYKNEEKVQSLEKHSQNSISLTLDGVFDFMKKSKDFNPSYKVFRDYFVLCWAGKTEIIDGKTYYSRVNIELINEQVKLFYSYHDKVEIEINDHSFHILEYINLGLSKPSAFYPLEKIVISFNENMTYDIKNEIVFKPPRFNQKTLRHYLNYNNYLIDKLKNNKQFTTQEIEDLNQLPSIYLIGYLSAVEEDLYTLEKLENIKLQLKNINRDAYNNYKDTMRIIRKLKYN